MVKNTNEARNLNTFTHDDATVVLDDSSVPRLWLFWLDEEKDARGFSTRALHFVDVERGDLVVVDGRTDMGYVEDVARRRGIPRDRIYQTRSSATLNFAAQATREVRDIGAWVRRRVSRVVLVPAKAFSVSFAEFRTQLQRHAPADLDIATEGEDVAWALLFGNKGIVHPRIGEGTAATSLWERALDEGGSGDVRVPRGFLCRGREEVFEAWCRLGDPSIALKEIDSSGGVGVRFLRSLDDLAGLDIGHEEIIVEEDLRVRHDTLRFLTIHYEGTRLGPVMEQKFLNDDDGEMGTLYSGSRTICQDSDVVRRIRAGMQAAIDQLQPRHLGGFDVAVGDDEHLYLLDINSARFNGSHTAMAAMRWRFPDCAHFSCFQMTMSRPVPFGTLRRAYSSAPWCEPVCYDGRTARWVVCGSSPEECAAREEELRAMLNKV